MIDVRGLTKVIDTGVHRVEILKGIDLIDPGRPICGHHGCVRQRQKYTAGTTGRARHTHHPARSSSMAKKSRDLRKTNWRLFEAARSASFFSRIN